MSSLVAKRKCPDLIFVPPRFSAYREVSTQIREIFFEYTNLVEPLSLDEAFLDVTENKKGIQVATSIAMEIKTQIKSTTGLTASAGVSFNKFLAKIASDYNKPDGLFVVKPQEAEAFVEKLAVEKFFGIGKVTAGKMHKIGIHTGKELKEYSQANLVQLFGKVGTFYYNIARGVDERPVNSDRSRKSIGTEFTFDHDLITLQEILFELKTVENELYRRIEKSEAKGRTLTLKVKFEDFEQITRSKSLPCMLSREQIHTLSLELAEQVNFGNKGVRLLGLTLSNLYDENNMEGYQLEIDFRND